MNRRTVIGLTAAATAGLAAAPAPASAEQARRAHQHGLDVARLEISATGERYKASNHSDESLKQRLAAQARVFARHHKALAEIDRA
ncbi:MAG: hypothetical protein K1X35_07635 [Caulobacteraceae bacterium]|nr:hypothetical protein [Caulobacteraceae bacterium]